MPVRLSGQRRLSPDNRLTRLAMLDCASSPWEQTSNAFIVTNQARKKSVREKFGDMNEELSFLLGVAENTGSQEEFQQCIEGATELLNRACKPRYQRYRFGTYLNHFGQHLMSWFDFMYNYRASIESYRDTRRNV